MHPNHGRVVSNFIIQALQGNMTIHGKGEQTCSFQYVSDLVEGMHSLMNGDYNMPVNLGTPTNIPSRILPSTSITISGIIDRCTYIGYIHA